MASQWRAAGTLSYSHTITGKYIYIQRDTYGYFLKKFALTYVPQGFLCILQLVMNGNLA